MVSAGQTVAWPQDCSLVSSNKLVVSSALDHEQKPLPSKGGRILVTSSCVSDVVSLQCFNPRWPTPCLLEIRNCYAPENQQRQTTFLGTLAYFIHPVLPSKDIIILKKEWNPANLVSYWPLVRWAILIEGATGCSRWLLVLYAMWCEGAGQGTDPQLTWDCWVELVLSVTCHCLWLDRKSVV